MESKQTSKKSKPNVILAKTRITGKLQGEGDYEAARRYDSGVRKFVGARTSSARLAPQRRRTSARRRKMAAAEAIGRQGEPQQAGCFSLTWKAFAAGHARSSKPRGHRQLSGGREAGSRALEPCRGH